MNSKERVERAVNFKKVDRVPAGLFGTHQEYEQELAEYIGVNTVEEMYKTLGIDIWHCKQGLQLKESESIWGDYDKEPLLGEVTAPAEVEKFEFARVEQMDNTQLAREIEEHQDFAVCAGINSAIFHNYLDLCGQEQALCLLKTDPEIAQAIIKKITDFWLKYLEKVLETGKDKIDIIENCNDFGTQRSLFISKEDFKTFFKPQLQRLYDKAKSYGVYYMQHSCGAISPLISDFIEMGADILNPIQTNAKNMDIRELHDKFGNVITFYGGIDTQHLLPEGPESKIRKEVRKILKIFGKDGGYILSGAQGLIEDIPFSHAAAMLEENKKF